MVHAREEIQLSVRPAFAPALSYSCEIDWSCVASARAGYRTAKQNLAKGKSGGRFLLGEHGDKDTARAIHLDAVIIDNHQVTGRINNQIARVA